MNRLTVWWCATCSQFTGPPIRIVNLPKFIIQINYTGLLTTIHVLFLQLTGLEIAKKPLTSHELPSRSPRGLEGARIRRFSLLINRKLVCRKIRKNSCVSSCLIIYTSSLLDSRAPERTSRASARQRLWTKRFFGCTVRRSSTDEYVSRKSILQWPTNGRMTN